jgi:hypothetical protein
MRTIDVDKYQNSLKMCETSLSVHLRNRRHSRAIPVRTSPAQANPVRVACKLGTTMPTRASLGIALKMNGKRNLGRPSQFD